LEFFTERGLTRFLFVDKRGKPGAISLFS